MKHHTGKKSVLVIDHDKTFIDNLRKNKAVMQYPVIATGIGRDAQLIISDKHQQLMGIFLNPEVKDPSWVSIVKCAHIHRNGVPVYLIQSGKETWREITSFDLESLGIKSTISKNISYEEMIQMVAPAAVGFDPTKALEIAKGNKDKLGAASVDPEVAFMPIRSGDFVAGTDSFFDVYVKMKSGRFIKLLHAGDSFDAGRLSNYIKKGVENFYIRGEAQEVYLNYCDHIATALLNKDTVSAEFKSKQVLNHGEEVMSHFRHHGVTDKNLAYAEKFTENIRGVLTQIKPEHQSLVGDFMDDVSCYDHAVGTTMLSGMLANHLKISSENTFQVVATAAMFHDLALIKMPENFADEDESKMTKEQIALYRRHPQLSAELLKRVSRVSAGTIQAVEQHHMRLGGAGFPERTTTTLVSRVAEIVGICEEINRVMRKCQQNSYLDVFVELDQHVFPYFSRAVTRSAKEVFYPKHPDMILG